MAGEPQAKHWWDQEWVIVFWGSEQLDGELSVDWSVGSRSDCNRWLRRHVNLEKQMIALDEFI